MQEADFEAVVRETVAELPHWVQEAMHNVEILVLDEADDHLDPDNEGLLGLYTGVSLPEREANHAGELPDVIYIFRLPRPELGLQPNALRKEIHRTPAHQIVPYFTSAWLTIVWRRGLRLMALSCARSGRARKGSVGRGAEWEPPARRFPFP